MKTLVIHPRDRTTKFLSVIYKNQDWYVINDPRYSKSKLRKQIINHDRIIMLGHGTENGLIRPNTYSFMIDSQFVQFLREKECIGIWCNADKFFDKYNLKGVYSGMIISELEEAYDYGYKPKWEEIEQSNKVFAKAVRKMLLSENYDKSKFLDNYNLNYGFAMFNRENIYKR